MVLFLNVRLEQAVLVQHRGRAIPGKVKYKGHLNQEIGEWVGVALDYPRKSHDLCSRLKAILIKIHSKDFRCARMITEQS